MSKTLTRFLNFFQPSTLLHFYAFSHATTSIANKYLLNNQMNLIEMVLIKNLAAALIAAYLLKKQESKIIDF